MEKPEFNQLELFSAESSARVRRRNFFSFRLRGNERALLFVIAAIALSIISFSLGVERGKRIASAKHSLSLDLAASAPAKKVKAELAGTVEKGLPPAQINLQQKPQDVQQQDGYLIQLASYKNRSFAQREADQLKSKGYNPLIMQKGSYVVLYVGSFKDKKIAQAGIVELQKRYSGCLIRRL